MDDRIEYCVYYHNVDGTKRIDSWITHGELDPTLWANGLQEDEQILRIGEFTLSERDQLVLNVLGSQKRLLEKVTFDGIDLGSDAIDEFLSSIITQGIQNVQSAQLLSEKPSA